MRLFKKLELCKKSGSLGLRFATALAAGVVLAGCQDEGLNSGRAYQPIPEQTLALMGKIGATKYSPILLRAFKKESELEIWKMKADGTYAHLKTYPMCRWSGQLGPKRREGDRQVPEGFYYVTPQRMNPNSAYYLSFNVGYPNAYDRAHQRTGSMIMVHGACSSRGCFSMSDEQIAEIYAVVRESFSGGQKAVQLQSLPFRMTPKNFAKHRLDKNFRFWQKLKEGADHFEVAKREPSVTVCNRQYVFNAKPVNASARIKSTASCPPLERDEALLAAVKKKQANDQTKVAAQIAKGTHPVKIVYADGGQHTSFAHVNDVSRPGALASGPIEIALDGSGNPLKKKTLAEKTIVAVANAKSGSKVAVKNASDGASMEAVRTAKAASGRNVGAVQKTRSTPNTPAAASFAGTSMKSRRGSTVVPANATAYAPPAPAEKKPLLSRWFGGLGLSRPAVKPAPAAMSTPVAPTEPQRELKVQSSKPKRDKQASALPGLIRGAQPPLLMGFAAYAPLR